MKDMAPLRVILAAVEKSITRRLRRGMIAQRLTPQKASVGFAVKKKPRQLDGGHQDENSKTLYSSRIIGFVGFAKQNLSASFDCAYASSPTEKTICNNQHLSRLDYLMGLIWADEKRSNEERNLVESLASPTG